MNFLKIIIVGILTILIAYTTACLFSPSRVVVSETIVIRSPAEEVYNELATLKNWKAWHPLFSQLNDDEVNIEMLQEKLGSSISWNTEDQRGGKIVLAEMDSFTRIKLNVFYEREGYEKENESEFLLEEGEKSTKITWVVIGTEYPFLVRPATLMLKEVFSKNIQLGLIAFKKHCEKSPSPNPTPQ